MKSTVVDSLKYVLIFLFDTHLDSCHGRVRVPGLRKILQRAVIPASASLDTITQTLSGVSVSISPVQLSLARAPRPALGACLEITQLNPLILSRPEKRGVIES